MIYKSMNVKILMSRAKTIIHDAIVK
jgi:hypothetical protein